MSCSAKRDSNGTWHIQYRWTDWTGTKKKSQKRGFKTKKEAEEWYAHFILQQTSDLTMTLNYFWEIYKADMEKRLRKTTMKQKEYVMKDKVLPYFGNTPINAITAPKTESSVRVITIHKELQDEIREHISTLYRSKPGTRLFVGRTKSLFEHEMERGIKSSGVKKITVHCTRHSHARLILSNQLSVGYIPICMQILDLSRRNWKMGGKNSLYVLFCIDDYIC